MNFKYFIGLIVGNNNAYCAFDSEFESVFDQIYQYLFESD